MDESLYESVQTCPYLCIYCSIIAQTLNMSDQEFARQVAQFDQGYVGYMDYLDNQADIYKIGINVGSSLI